MSMVAAVDTAFPPHHYLQDEITAVLAEVVLGRSTSAEREALRRLHAATTVASRSLALTLPEYAELDGFGEANDAWLRVGTELGERAVRGALEQVGLRPDDVDLIVDVSVTGIGAPSLDARLMAPLGLRPDVKRLPVFGLGCVAGAAGIARVHDYLLGHPDDVAVLLAVELCSLTFQRDDRSMANLVASGLFGDGCAAVVIVGERRAATLGLTRRAGPRVVDSCSRFYAGTERVMGWDIGDSGFRIVLSADVPRVVEENVGDDVRTFLEGHDLKVADIDTFVAHPGGPKVLEAMQRSLDLPDDALEVTWRCLAATGNLSSASVLQVLGRTVAEGLATPGRPGLLLAMGPGFCAELVLLEW